MIIGVCNEYNHYQNYTFSQVMFLIKRKSKQCNILMLKCHQTIKNSSLFSISVTVEAVQEPRFHEQF